MAQYDAASSISLPWKLIDRLLPQRHIVWTTKAVELFVSVYVEFCRAFQYARESLAKSKTMLKVFNERFFGVLCSHCSQLFVPLFVNGVRDMESKLKAFDRWKEWHESLPRHWNQINFTWKAFTKSGQRNETTTP